MKRLLKLFWILAITMPVTTSIFMISNEKIEFNQSFNEKEFELEIQKYEKIVKKIDEHINQMLFLDLNMEVNFNSGVDELYGLIRYNIESTISDLVVKEYFQHNFVILDVLYANQSVTNDFFKESTSKIGLWFKYIVVDNFGYFFNSFKTVNFYLTINQSFDQIEFKNSNQYVDYFKISPLVTAIKESNFNNFTEEDN